LLSCWRAGCIGIVLSTKSNVHKTRSKVNLLYLENTRALFGTWDNLYVMFVFRVLGAGPGDLNLNVQLQVCKWVIMV